MRMRMRMQKTISVAYLSLSIHPRTGVVQLFEKYRVPRYFDLLSVDTDLYDLFLIDRILRAGYRPRAIVSEINRNFFPREAFSVVYSDSQGRWDMKSAYMGASTQAIDRLLSFYGYTFVLIDSCASERNEKYNHLYEDASARADSGVGSYICSFLTSIPSSYPERTFQSNHPQPALTPFSSATTSSTLPSFSPSINSTPPIRTYTATRNTPRGSTCPYTPTFRTPSGSIRPPRPRGPRSRRGRTRS